MLLIITAQYLLEMTSVYFGYAGEAKQRCLCKKKTDAFPLWDVEVQPTATNIDMIIKKKSTLFHNVHPNRHHARALLAVGCPNHYKD